MYIRKHLSQLNRQDIDKTSQFLLQPTLDDAQQVLVIALPLKKLKDLEDSLHQLLGQPHLLLLPSAVIGIPGDDSNEVILGLVLGLVEGEAGEVLELLDALLHPACVEFYDLVEVGDRQHCPFITNFYLSTQTRNKIYLTNGRTLRKYENQYCWDWIVYNFIRNDHQTIIIDKWSNPYFPSSFFSLQSSPTCSSSCSATPTKARNWPS